MAAATQVFGPGTTPGSGGSIPAEVRQSYNTRLLLAAKPDLIHAQFADDQPIPKGEGTTMQMRRWELLPVATTPLTEGVTPTGNQATVTPVMVSIAQYGDYIQASDVMTWAAIDPVMNQYIDLLAFQASQTIDVLARDFMALGTNVLYANGRTSRSGSSTTSLQAGDKITSVELKKAVRNLKKSFVQSINGKYVAIVSPDVVYDLMSIDEWLKVSEYQDKKNLYNGEVGELYGIRFVESPLAKVYAGASYGGSDVHAILVFGKRAFVKTGISGEKGLKSILKPIGSGGTSDPLDQRASAGWKTTFGGTIANQVFCVRIEVTVTA
jgi:N4-gp56 family major capsid protein